MSQDQAARLRSLAQGQRPEAPLFAARVVAITSGKGGVGKTNVVAGLTPSLAQPGPRGGGLEEPPALLDPRAAVRVDPDVVAADDVEDGLEALGAGAERV